MATAVAQLISMSVIQDSRRSFIMTREGEVLGPVLSSHEEHIRTQKTSASRPIAPTSTTQQDPSLKDMFQGFLAKTWNAWGSHKPTNSTVATLKAEEALLRRNRSESTSTIETCSDGSAEFYADIDLRMADGTHISQQSLYAGELYTGDKGSATTKANESGSHQM